MTIKDIAKESGYGVSTVSRVLNNHPDVSDEARRHILKVMKINHFIPNSNARRLKSSISNNIVILVKGNSNMFFRSIGEKIQSLISKQMYNDIIRFIDEDGNEVLRAKQLVNDLNPRGLLFLGGTLRNFSDYFSSISIPCLLLTNGVKDLGFSNLSSVCTDDLSGAETAAGYLIEHGHRHIGIIGGSTDVSFTSALRGQGCLNALERAGISFDKSVQYKSCRYSFEKAYRCMSELLDGFPQITAVFAMSDIMAIGAIRAIRDRGLRVPEDISVIGYDGIELSKFYNPKLTTIVQDQELLTRRGVEILIDSIESRTPARHEVIPFHLAAGESVAAPRH